MKYSDPTNKDGIIQNCESLCKLGDAGITGNTILFAKFNGYINTSLDKVAAAILTVDKNWRWDDNNYETPNAVPVATADLVDGQRQYILPRATNTSDQSTLWRVYKVRILDSGGTWYDLVPLGADEDEIADEGKPSRYRMLGNTIRLSSPPDSGSVTLDEGIQVWFQRTPTHFETTDTTKQPGFLSSHHHILQLDASAQYLLPINTNLANEYITLFKSELEDLKILYGTRNDDSNNTKQMIPNIENTK